MRAELLAVMEVLKHMGTRGFAGGMKDDEIATMEAWIAGVEDMLRREEEMAEAERAERSGWTWLRGDWTGREVERELASALESHPDYAVTIAGHSLGGALAELAFGSLKPKALNVTQVFTYGAPRVGNKGFADFIDTLAGASDTNPGISYRVTHWNGAYGHVWQDSGFPPATCMVYVCGS